MRSRKRRNPSEPIVFTNARVSVAGAPDAEGSGLGGFIIHVADQSERPHPPIALPLELPVSLALAHAILDTCERAGVSTSNKPQIVRASGADLKRLDIPRGRR